MRPMRYLIAPHAGRRALQTMPWLLVALVAGACMGATPTPGPSTAPTSAATAGPGVPADTPGGQPTLPPASTSPPASFAPDQQLAAVMPASIGGGQCQNVTFHLSDAFSTFSADGQAAFQRMADALGVALDQISLGSASCSIGVGGETVAVGYGTYRAQGTDPDKLVDGFLVLRLDGQEAPPSTVPATVGGKSVTKATHADGTVEYLYGSGDVLFIYPSQNQQTDDVVLASFP